MSDEFEDYDVERVHPRMAACALDGASPDGTRWQGVFVVDDDASIYPVYGRTATERFGPLRMRAGVVEQLVFQEATETCAWAQRGVSTEALEEESDDTCALAAALVQFARVAGWKAGLWIDPDAARPRDAVVVIDLFGAWSRQVAWRFTERQRAEWLRAVPQYSGTLAIPSRIECQLRLRQFLAESPEVLRSCLRA